MNRRDRKKQEKRKAREERLRQEKRAASSSSPEAGRTKPYPVMTAVEESAAEKVEKRDERVAALPMPDDFFRFHHGAEWLNGLLLAEPGSNYSIEPLWNGEIPDHLMLNAKTSCQILVAAEMIAAGIGRPSRHLSPKAAEYVAERDCLYSPGLVALAASCVRRVGDFSELREIISRAGMLELWLSGIEDLYRRLQIRGAKAIFGQ